MHHHLLSSILFLINSFVNKKRGLRKINSKQRSSFGLQSEANFKPIWLGDKKWAENAFIGREESFRLALKRIISHHAFECMLAIFLYLADPFLINYFFWASNSMNRALFFKANQMCDDHQTSWKWPIWKISQAWNLRCHTIYKQQLCLETQSFGKIVQLFIDETWWASKAKVYDIRWIMILLFKMG